VDGLASNDLQAVAADGKGNKRFATHGHGVSVLAADGS